MALPPSQPGPIFKAKTAIQDISDRLRRAFGAAGEIPISLGEQIQLHARVADVTEPGNSPYRGRFFAASIAAQLAAVGSTAWALRNNDQVVYTHILYSSVAAAGDTFSVFNLDPTTAPLNVPTFQCGVWTDQRRNVGDRPPLLDNNNLYIADATAYGTAHRVFTLNGAAAAAVGVIPVFIHAFAGATLVFQNNLGAGKVIGISVFGKIF